MLERFDQRLTERYIKAELQLLIQFRIRGINEELVACLEREQPVGGPKKEGWELNVPEAGEQTLEGWTDVDAPKGRADRNHKAVLVDEVCGGARVCHSHHRMV